MDPDTGADNAYMLYVIKNGEAFNNGKADRNDVGVEAIDDDTLVVTLEHPTAYFLKLLASHGYYPVNKKTVEIMKIGAIMRKQLFLMGLINC